VRGRVASIEKAAQNDTLTDRQSDIGGSNVGSKGHVADGEVGLLGGDCEEVVNPSGKGLDGAERLVERGMVHGTAALTILLVINVQSNGIGLTEL
jgi:hypothetical protein